jgi:23S rRNA (cytidine1920-2'-O)/16S rRNA (cytidine1409-2'-O)-methyltransferase
LLSVPYTTSKNSIVTKIRADRLLVSRGFFDTRARAQAAIEAGLVTADGVAVRKPAQTIPENAEIHASPAHRYVSRGGLKLAAALEHFATDPQGKVCLDVGASTGGFTDLLLSKGAALVYAVDVGRDQLHSSLRGREDVRVMEKADIRKLDATMFSKRPQIIAVDVSFISLKQVLPAVTGLAASRAELIALIKPQFEAGRKSVGKGIVRDPAIHRAVCEEITDFSRGLGWAVRGVVASPLSGGDGNREFLLGAGRNALRQKDG